MKHLGYGGDHHEWEECQCPQWYVDQVENNRMIKAFSAVFAMVCLIATFVALVN